jgi:soluble lytic murein transglycosylase-like protein
MKQNILIAAASFLALSLISLAFEMHMVKVQKLQILKVTKREEVNTILVNPGPVKPTLPARTNESQMASASVNSVEQNLYDHMVKQAVPESTARKYAQLIIRHTDRYGVDPYTILAMIQIESRFNADIVGKADDVGLLQIRPTAQKATGIKGDRSDPEVNIEIGVKYLAYNQKRFGRELGIVAYNQGEGKVARGTYNTKYLTKVENISAEIYR